MSRYRGRIAPSPTGQLHAGHAATFATAAGRAGAHSGELILRMDDLDPQRSRPELASCILEDLRWLGISWQEGPDISGPLGPYRQSERIHLYREALQKLAALGFLYPCDCSRKDLASAAQAPHGEEWIYPGTCRPQMASHLPPESVNNVGINWRFRVSQGEIVCFFDCNNGLQSYVAGTDFGDFLVWRRDGVPAYQLAVAVDDAAMQITEVIRGADLLLSTARQILLCRALELAVPKWYHCPIIRNAAGERLAKRHNALSLRELRASGMKPEEVLRLAAASADRPASHRGPDL